MLELRVLKHLNFKMIYLKQIQEFSLKTIEYKRHSRFQHKKRNHERKMAMVNQYGSF